MSFVPKGFYPQDIDPEEIKRAVTVVLNALDKEKVPVGPGVMGMRYILDEYEKRGMFVIPNPKPKGGAQ